MYKFVASCICWLVVSFQTPAVLGQSSKLGRDNAVRIAEANHLLNHVRAADWFVWENVPFAIILLTEDRDFLIGHPNPSNDFTSEGIDPIVGLEVFSRLRTTNWPSGMLATFPAVQGLPTIIVGPAEASGKTSGEWVTTLLHEHLHQIQYGWPEYYAAVSALDLSKGDESGMWMLNYDFPYGDEVVSDLLSRLATGLNDSLDSLDAQPTVKALLELRTVLSEEDFRYLTFQFWQEGIARFFEYAVAEAAMDGYTPLPSFSALDDFESYGATHSLLISKLKQELSSIDSANQQRIVVYPIGGALGLMINGINKEWTKHYLRADLDVLPLLDSSLKK